MTKKRRTVFDWIYVVLIIVVWGYAVATIGDGCLCRTQISDADCERVGGEIEYRWDVGRSCSIPSGWCDVIFCDGQCRCERSR